LLSVFPRHVSVF